MKYLKILGLAAVIAAALMAFAGSASATTLTNSSGTTLGVGTVIKASLKEKTKAVLKNSFGVPIECEISNIEGEITNAGGTSETVKGKVTKLTFEGCNCEVVVLKTGTLEIHTTTTGVDDGNGTVTATGQEVTTNRCTGTHCIWSTNNTDLGMLFHQRTAGAPSEMTAEETKIERTGGSSGIFCGSSGNWTATYVLTSPTTLWVH